MNLWPHGAQHHFLCAHQGRNSGAWCEDANFGNNYFAFTSILINIIKHYYWFTCITVPTICRSVSVASHNPKAEIQLGMPTAEQFYARDLDTIQSGGNIDVLGLGQAMIDFAATVEDDWLVDLQVDKGCRKWVIKFFYYLYQLSISFIHINQLICLISTVLTGWLL